MSLKNFHIVFITLSVICTLGFAAWVYVVEETGPLLQATGITSGLMGIALVVYGSWFAFRKSRQLIT